MFLHITHARYLNNYCIEVIFNNGKTGIADLSEVLKGSIFEPLKNTELFAKFHVDKELETIVWENGADLAPEYVYFQAFKKNPDLQTLFKEWGYVE